MSETTLEVTRERMPAENFRVEIDHDRCQGHARCAALASAIFSVNDDGYGVVLIDGAIPVELLDKAYLAQSNCPETAIKITEQGT